MFNCCRCDVENSVGDNGGIDSELIGKGVVESNVSISSPNLGNSVGISAMASGSEQNKVLTSFKNANGFESGKSSVNSGSEFEPVLEQVVDYVLFPNAKKSNDVVTPRDVNVKCSDDNGVHAQPILDSVVQNDKKDKGVKRDEIMESIFENSSLGNKIDNVE
ncbi:hypothetical protein L6452_09835 [Arctium lappa]|uniref:Uncharacterized protein n=1 Tax=Arctium lappa TaxID=4217 RepID=A0ACB9DLP9_ARCLA|nr:hypothetical protein L6452_09835 [Arctium lappa]